MQLWGKQNTQNLMTWKKVMRIIIKKKKTKERKWNVFLLRRVLVGCPHPQCSVMPKHLSLILRSCRLVCGWCKRQLRSRPRVQTHNTEHVLPLLENVCFFNFYFPPVVRWPWMCFRKNVQHPRCYTRVHNWELPKQTSCQAIRSRLSDEVIFMTWRVQHCMKTSPQLISDMSSSGK